MKKVNSKKEKVTAKGVRHTISFLIYSKLKSITIESP